jgi:hypothetical protein
MADALSKFISGLATLDPSNLGAPANKAALQKFQSLPGAEQRDVLNGVAASVGATFAELDALSDSDKQRVTANVQAGRNAFHGVNRQPAQAEAKTFEQKWAQSSEQREQAGAYHPSNDKSFEAKYGATDASNRFGYRPPHRQAQIERIASIQAEAKATNKTFSEVADARVAAGK